VRSAPWPCSPVGAATGRSTGRTLALRHRTPPSAVGARLCCRPRAFVRSDLAERSRPTGRTVRRRGRPHPRFRPPTPAWMRGHHDARLCPASRPTGRRAATADGEKPVRARMRTCDLASEPGSSSLKRASLGGSSRRECECPACRAREAFASVAPKTRAALCGLPPARSTLIGTGFVRSVRAARRSELLRCRAADAVSLPAGKDRCEIRRRHTEASSELRDRLP
jgi:hypothetical protein